MANLTVILIGDLRLSAKKCLKTSALAALGPRGVAEMRAQGALFDKAVPAAYYAALPGIFDGDRLLECPVLTPNQADFQLSSVYYHGFYRDIIAGGRG